MPLAAMGAWLAAVLRVVFSVHRWSLLVALRARPGPCPGAARPWGRCHAVSRQLRPGVLIQARERCWEVAQRATVSSGARSWYEASCRAAARVGTQPSKSSVS